MLDLTLKHTIGTSTAFGDDRDPHLFYILPTEVDYRRSGDGSPMAKLVLYRFPLEIDSPRAGGYFMLEVVPTVPADELATVEAELRRRVGEEHAARVRVRMLAYDDATAQVWCAGGTEDVAVHAGSARLSLELDRNRATILKAANEHGDSTIGAVFDLRFKALGPAVRCNLSFDADRFFDFHGLLANLKSAAEIPVDRQTVIGSGAGHVRMDGADAGSTAAMQAITEAAEEELVSLTRQRLAHLDTLRAWTRDIYDDLHDALPGRLRETEFAAAFASLAGPIRESASFEQTVTRREVVDRTLVVQGILAPFGSDHVSLFDLAHYVLDELSVYFLVDFDRRLGIEKVDLHVRHRGETTTHTIHETSETWRYLSLSEAQGETYSYWCDVYLAGEPKPLRTPETQATERNAFIMIRPSDVGRYLKRVVHVPVGYIDEVDIELRVTHPILDEPLERVAHFDHTSVGEQTIVFDVGEAYDSADLECRYRATYSVVDAPSISGDWIVVDDREISIATPFERAEKIRFVGIFRDETATVSLDVVCSDDRHDFEYSRHIELSSTSPEAEMWVLRLDKDAGTTSYTGRIAFGDGRVQQIENTVVTTTNIVILAVPEPTAEIG